MGEAAHANRNNVRIRAEATPLAAVFRLLIIRVRP
jgi:hypothetical protein